MKKVHATDGAEGGGEHKAAENRSAAASSGADSESEREGGGHGWSALGMMKDRATMAKNQLGPQLLSMKQRTSKRCVRLWLLLSRLAAGKSLTRARSCCLADSDGTSRPLTRSGRRLRQVGRERLALQPATRRRGLTSVCWERCSGDEGARACCSGAEYRQGRVNAW